MLFNTLNFALFFVLIYFIYWRVLGKRFDYQNILLLVASYFFYSFWDYRFLFLLVFSTLLDYFTGLQIERYRSARRKKFWFWASVVINLGFLGFFKYYNFFIESFASGLASLGIQVHYSTLQIILPVGISFYTFHGLSYVIDIYKGRIQAERNFVSYSLFVSYFPLLVAGPIERATHLLPQIKKVRTFEYAKSVDGLKQILWGLFKKVVIADQCAPYVNDIFSQVGELNGSTLLLGAILFSFQIYGDFSGYSDIALGTSRLLGIELLRNFSYPYFSRDIAEFWRKWHISLSSWFRDYVYIPLGGSKCGRWISLRNTFIIFLLSGFWHGANWTFIAWGLMHAFLFIPLMIFGQNRKHTEGQNEMGNIPSPISFLKMLWCFLLITNTWILFRAASITDAYAYYTHMYNKQLFTLPEFRPWLLILTIFGFMTIEWIGHNQVHPLASLFKSSSKLIRWGLYILIGIAIVITQGKEQTFIYFQF
jgi:alginate O-acetyltransferase complex protein AlgI